MTETADLLADLFGKTTGDITLFDAAFPDGEMAYSDFDEMARAIGGMADPWVDLVTSDGQAIGVFVPGNPKIVKPEPSVVLNDGAVYLLDGEPLAEQQRGVHTCPLSMLARPDDLIWYDPNKLDVQTPASNFEIILMQGRRRDEGQGKWKEIKSLYGQFSDFLREHKEGPKDGPCFLQGRSIGGTRKAAAMERNFILGVDLDSGAPLGDVIDTIQRHGLEAVIYTTHSHLKDTSVIKRDDYFKKTGEMTPTAEGVANYLMTIKGTLPHIVQSCEVLDDSHHTEDGVVILVKHEPMPKFRAVFPLSEPFVFAARGGTQQDAIMEWKERYAGFCTELGLFFDEKCVDPARLFYFPRHPKGDSTYGSWHIAGLPLKLDDYDRVKIRRGKDGRKVLSGGPQNAFTAAAGGLDEESDHDRYITASGFDLRAWSRKYGKRFEIEAMLEEVVGGDFMREPRTGGKPGIHVECPFESEHTSFGGGGTYVVNASDNYDDGFEGGFTFHCVHNACSGRDRLDFLKALLDEEVISVADLTNKDFLIEFEGDEVEEEEAPPARPAQARRSSSDDAVPLVASGHDLTDDSDFGDDEDSMMRAFNRRYAVIRTSGGVRILVEPRTSEDDVVFESQNDVSLFEKNRVLWTGGGKKGESAKKHEAFKLWLEHEKRRTYTRVVFAPGRRTSRDTYNLFQGWPYEPKEGSWSILRQHVFENICESNEEHFDWFMTWMSHLFQHPDDKPGSTVAVIGNKGTGKSTLFAYLNKLLGRHGITVSQRKQIVGQFNAHLATTLLMVCEEAFWAADQQAEGVLKDMITNKSVLIEKKGYDPIQSANYTRLALISNNEWVVPASLKDERRFFVLRCSDDRQGDLAYFGAMRHQMENEGGLEALLYELLHWKPIHGTFASLYTPPTTKYLKLQQVESLSGVHKFMLELVKSGIYEVHDDKVQPIELELEKETWVSAAQMRAAVEDYVRFRFPSDKAKTSYDDISAVVQDWFGARETKISPEGSTNRRRMFIFPPLSVARAKLKETKGLDIEAMPEEEVRAMKTRQ